MGTPNQYPFFDGKHDAVLSTYDDGVMSADLRNQTHQRGPISGGAGDFLVVADSAKAKGELKVGDPAEVQRNLKRIEARRAQAGVVGAGLHGTVEYVPATPDSQSGTKDIAQAS